MEDKLVSIIIPVYNAKETLAKCVTSVLDQTYKNVEIILVDDGSSDGSAAICDSFMEKDSRVKCFHKENGGVSSARNLGLSRASGYWISFLDSDDWFEPSYIEDLASAGGEDFVVGGFNQIGAKKRLSEPVVTRTFNIRSCLEKSWNKSISGFVFWYPWGKLFRRDVLVQHGLEFNEKMFYSEDANFVFEYMRYIESCTEVKTSGYVHFFESGRSSKYKMNYETLRTHLDFLLSNLSQLEQKNDHHYVLVRRNLCKRFAFNFLVYLLMLDTYSEYKRELSCMKKDSMCEQFKIAISFWGKKITLRRRMLSEVVFRLPSFVSYPIRSKLLSRVVERAY